jgi:hypothetical protein
LRAALQHFKTLRDSDDTLPVAKQVYDGVVLYLEASNVGEAEQQAEAVLPEGWSLVPLVPTQEMLKAALPYHWFTRLGPELTNDWRKMIAAAPSPSKPVREAETLIEEICDRFGIGSSARSRSTILANIDNCIRRERCLGKIEDYLSVEVPGEDENGDPTDPEPESLLNWGDDPEQYIERFQSIVAPPAPQETQAAGVTEAMVEAACAVFGWIKPSQYAISSMRAALEAAERVMASSYTK